MPRKTKLILDTMEKFSKVLLSLLFSVMVFSIFLQVVMRYVFHTGNAWAEELAIFSFAWLVMIGSSVAIRGNRHMNIDFLMNYFPLTLKKITQMVLNLLLMVFMGLLIIKGTELVLLTHRQLSTGMGLPMSIPYLSIPVGAVLSLLYILEAMFRSFKRGVEQ